MRFANLVLAAVLACALGPSAAFAEAPGPLTAGAQEDAAPARDGEDHGAVVATGECGENAAFAWHDDGTVFVYPKVAGEPATVGKLTLDRYNEWTIRDAEGTAIWYPVEGYSSAERDSMLAALKQGFAKENSLKALVIEDGIAVVSDGAFAGEEWLVPTLRSVKLPEHLDYLGRSAFQGLTQLASVDMPLTIGNNASYVFENTGIREVRLPVVTAGKETNIVTDSLGRISETWCSPYHQWFDRCQLLERIVVPEGATYLGGTPTADSTDINVQAFGHRLPSLKYVELPSTLVEVGSGSLDWYRSLEWVRFKSPACPGFAGTGNLFTERFAGSATVYFPEGGTGYGYGWAGSVARQNEWIDVRIAEVPDFAALPDASAVSLSDADACAAIRAAQAFWDAAGDEARSWAGDALRLEAAAGALDALELQESVAGAQAELAAYADPASYRAAQQALLADAVAAGIAEIGAAADEGAIASALAAAKAAIDAIPTDAQLAAQEKAAAEEAEREAAEKAAREKAEREAAEKAAREAWARAHNLANATVSTAGATYTGKALAPAVSVKAPDGTLLAAGTDYTVSYAANIHAGTGTATVAGKGSYTGSKTATFSIGKAANSVKLSKSKASKTYKAAKKTGKLASKKTIKLASALKAKAAFGTASFSKKSGSAYVKVAKNGTVTVKKGLKRGAYTVKVKVSVAAGADWKAASKTATLKITVK